MIEADVAVVGGSFAGVSAAIMLARARRRVVIIDEGATRNRFAHASHGFLGMDGAAPEAIREKGLAEVLAYSTARHVAGRVTAIRGSVGAFVLEGAEEIRAARVILAFGQRDRLPDIPGLADCWGRTVAQCPYCHGYELADRTTGLLAWEAIPMHHAVHLSDWTDDLILLENGVAMTADQAVQLSRPGLRRQAGRVVRVHHMQGAIDAVELEGGERVAMRALYLVSWQEPASDLAEALGCKIVETPMGRHLQVDDHQRTTVPGVFAAGDLARPFPSATQAASTGNRAGAACHQDLLGILE
ncbi:MAG: NAD(P)/FAD-dependent oxidoreductase [Tabrizicola sp.]|uniref:NAD(P)/FAD-dependent oxidoreductase n=1 Tax=Tabrizicola sp. TaxID=2005166 RepID=UPI002ABB5B4B|nr:NAD(P)/FAD-dependent oxidoreductase [Tabrizicola sp.]MDZ4086875.1 NAD(P)/FAD-dependent oxidoreductase [Tabrizicola sp.]